MTCNKSELHENTAPEPAFLSYRLAVHGSTQRRCRFKPSCSKFLIDSVKRHGFLKGVRNGFTRAQLRHDDSFGILAKELSLDKEMILILDPATNWDEK